MKIRRPVRNRILKRTRKGFQGYPVATVAWYGPDNQRASKVAVGIIAGEGVEPVMRKWYTEETDARFDKRVINEVMQWIEQSGAASVAAVDKIIGCPHEEETDYPAGTYCPRCPYWAGRNRWTE